MAGAVTQGDWKLFLDGGNAALNDSEETEAAPALFNIREDADETDDLSQQHPEKVAALKARALELIGALDSSEKLEIATPD